MQCDYVCFVTINKIVSTIKPVKIKYFNNVFYLKSNIKSNNLKLIVLNQH